MQSASTALSATMGTGNIAGVAGAVALGGAGAVFWMWVSAIFSMAVKYAEITLALRYRVRDRTGKFAGGLPYIIKSALHPRLHFLSSLFAFLGTIASFGIGNLTQISTVSGCVNIMGSYLSADRTTVFSLKLIIGAVCAVATLILLLSGSGRLGAFCERLVPLMTIGYLALSIGTLIYFHHALPGVFTDIFIGAFSPRAVTGGAVGSAFVAVKIGMSRGVFSNEAGLGTAASVYCCAENTDRDTALLGVFEVFVDTILCCTLTALCILSAKTVTFGTDTGAAAVFSAFSRVFGRGVVFVFCPVLCFFAFSSIIGWGFYGIGFAEYIFGKIGKGIYLIFFCLVLIFGAVMRVDAAWLVAEILNGLMILPSTLTLFLLSNEIKTPD